MAQIGKTADHPLEDRFHAFIQSLNFRCVGSKSALAPRGVTEDQIAVAFNCFMNVPVDAATGELRVDPPLSKAGESITVRAHMDLIIGLTACSALQSNNGSFKPIAYTMDDWGSALARRQIEPVPHPDLRP